MMNATSAEAPKTEQTICIRDLNALERVELLLQLQ